MRKRLSKLLSVCLSALIALSMFILIPTESEAAVSYKLSGTCHVQDYGDKAASFDSNSGILTLGTRGQSKRVEAMTINFTNNTGYSGTIQYRVHVQNIGWQGWKNAGEKAGTSGQALRLEGLEMKLTGELANHYIIQYRVHIQDYGDNQGWVNSGAMAGTAGESKRLEEVQVRLVPIGSTNTTSVKYRVHVQDFGWESQWKADGAVSGTTGQAKRLEGIEIHLDGAQYAGSITYHTHIQNIGWESTWATAGEMSGTQGMSYRLEGIEIALTGDMANHYDIYYRVHAQDFGWLGWAKNGQMSGTSGTGRRLEAIQIVLVAKNGANPGSRAGISSAISQPCVVGNNPTTWSTGTAPKAPAPTTTTTPRPTATTTTRPTATATSTPTATPTGTIKITNNLTAPAGSSVTSKTFTYTISGNGVSKTTTITGSGTATVTGLPVGNYTVTQSNADVSGLTHQVTGSGQSVSVAKGNTTSITITNTYSAPQTTQQVGSITIKNTINANAGSAPATRQYTFTINGTNYSTKITGTGTATLSGIPIGTYTVTMSNYDVSGFDRSGNTTKQVQVTNGGNASADFANAYTQQTGSIKIVHNITAPQGSAPLSTTYTFTIKNTSTNQTWDKTVTGSGNQTYSGFPVGNYTVTLKTTSVSGFNRSGSTSTSSFSVGKGDTKTATIASSFTQQTGNIKIVHNITAPSGSAPLSTTYTFTIRNTSTSQTWDKTVTGSGNQTYSGFPVGTYTVTIKTTSVSGFNRSGSTSTSSFSVGNGATATATISSSFTAVNTPAPTGSVTVYNYLYGAYSAAGAANLDFTYKFYNSSGTLVKTVSCKGGKSVQATGLPVGTYKVTQSVNSVSGYTLSVSPSTTQTNISVTQNGNINVTFNNTYTADSTPAPTAPATRPGNTYTLPTPFVVANQNNVRVTVTACRYERTPTRGMTLIVSIVNNSSYDLDIYPLAYAVNYTKDNNNSAGTVAFNAEWYSGTSVTVAAHTTGELLVTGIATQTAIRDSATSVNFSVGVYAPAGTKFNGNLNYFEKSVNNIPVWYS